MQNVNKSLQDPNAPCGASTAAPYFGARRLLQLVAFCSLQILNRSLMSAFLLAFNFWRFLRYLHVLYVFCEFVSCLAALAIFKYCCKKRIQNVSKMMPKSIRIHSIIIKMMPRGPFLIPLGRFGVPKMVPESKSAPGCQKGRYVGLEICDFWN